MTEILTHKDIRTIRIANGISQIDFANLIEIPVGTWSNVELGNQPLYKEMKAKAIQALKDLECDFDVLDRVYPKRTHVKRIKKQEEEKPVEMFKPTDSVEDARKRFEEKLDANKVNMIDAFVQAGNVVAGVGKDEPIVINEDGGGQSRTLYDFTLADPKAMFEMTKVLKEGADKYGAENWRLISIADHLNHLLVHVYAYLAGDKSDEHLSHIMCRALFAQGVAVQTEEDIERVKKAKGE